MSTEYEQSPQAVSMSLDSHAGYARTFRPGKLSFGFLTPLEGYPTRPRPTLQEHEQRARSVDQAGFAAIWLRDVLFYDPGFGDTGQMLDPFVYLGFLAAVTTNVALGTAGIVSPLRESMHIAKQAASVDVLSNGRLLLGMASGDRPVEYPALNVDYDSRASRFQESFDVVRRLTEVDFPHLETRHSGRLDGTLDMLPKAASRIPLLVVGRAQQSLEWIAGNADAWISYVSNMEGIARTLLQWKQACDGDVKPYGYGTFFDMDAAPDAPVRLEHGVLRGGRRRLVELWKQQESLGVSHVALNLKPMRRPFHSVMAELAEHVLPHFPSA